MQDFFRYCGLWFRRAFTESLGAVDLWTGLVSAALGLADHYLPRLQIMNSLGWEIPLWVLAGVLLVRLLVAPYWIWKEQQDELARLRPSRVAHCLGLRSINANHAPGDMVQLELVLANNADEAIEYGRI